MWVHNGVKNMLQVLFDIKMQEHFFHPINVLITPFYFSRFIYLFIFIRIVAYATLNLSNYLLQHYNTYTQFQTVTVIK